MTSHQVSLHQDASGNPASLASSIALGGCAIVAFAALLGLAWYSSATLFLIFAGLLFGIFLDALTGMLGRLTGGPHALRLGIVCVLLVGLFSGVLLLGSATIANQASALSSTIRSQVDTVKHFLEARGVDTSFLNLNVQAATEQASSETPPNQPASLPSAGTLASGASTLLGRTFTILTGVFGAVGNLFVVVLLGLLFAAQPALYRDGILSFVPKRYGAKAERFVHDVAETLRRWLLGQLLTMASLFVITWVGLSIIGIPGALVLGFITGLLSFIPNVGAVIAGALIVLASLGFGLSSILSAFGLYLFVQALEGNVLTPLIQRHAIEIPPATLFAAQIFLGVLFGLWGLALALPLIAIVKVSLRHFYQEADIDTAAAPA